jgi:Lamin Tail Domain
VRRVVILGLVMLGVVMMFGSPAQAAARVQIHEIWYNSPGRDTGSNSSLNQEWVQLHNTSGSWITMTGWTLRDANGHVYKFGTYRIKPHGYVKVHTGKGSNTQADRYWGRGWYVWNNTGDTATLKDARGSLLGRCSYRGTSTGYKIC